MPNRAAWAALLKETFHGVDRGDLKDLYHVEWQKAQEALVADHADVIAAERKGFRRGLRRISAVLYGVTKRLAPTRRLVYVLAFVFLVLGFIEFRPGDSEHGPDGSTTISIDLHFLSFGLLTLLLGMELVDKI